MTWLWRRFGWLALLLSLTGLMAFVTSDWRAAWGVLATSMVLWALYDALGAQRLRRWMRRPQGSAIEHLGPWGDAGERAAKLWRDWQRDIRSEQQRLSEFLAAIQASPNGIVLLDAQNRIEWCNATAQRLFGFELPRDRLQHVANLLRDPDFVDYINGGELHRECTITAPVSVHSAALIRVSIQLYNYGVGQKLMLVRDVTQVERADAMRRDFVANVSHEIRTPLTALRGYVETLQTLPLNEAERKQALVVMADQAHRMESLVGDLLVLSRLDGAAPPPIGQWVSVVDLLSKIERRMSSGRRHEHDFVQILEFHGELDAIEAEADSAVTNLLSNARRYTPAGRLIELSARRNSNGDLLIAVRDEGMGIAPEHLSRLTERFYRVDKSRSRDTGGTGLGLSIVKHVMQRHGGELLIESMEGVGSTFTLRWPSVRVRTRPATAMTDGIGATVDAVAESRSAF
jgi:two-component system, OmpR family, phosphate regulon sensor histidine kinase PhoR